MGVVVHLLSDPSAGLHTVRVACGVTMPELGTWQKQQVTCPQCLEARRTPASAGDVLPEKVLQEQVRQLCMAQKWIYFHAWSSRHSPSGYPDVTAIRGERLIVAELKRQGQAPSVAQARWLQAFREVRTVESYLWTPDDMQAILEALR